MFKDRKLNEKLKKAHKRWGEERRAKNDRKKDKRQEVSNPLFFKKVGKGKKVDPITPFEKNYYICWNFKEKFKKEDNETKLKELCRLAEIKIHGCKIPYKKRRKKRNLSRGRCWVCKEKSYCQHHIIQLQNGGYDNGINRIKICFPCHNHIHPWLESYVS